MEQESSTNNTTTNEVVQSSENEVTASPAKTFPQCRAYPQGCEPVEEQTQPSTGNVSHPESKVTTETSNGQVENLENIQEVKEEIIEGGPGTYPDENGSFDHERIDVVEEKKPEEQTEKSVEIPDNKMAEIQAKLAEVKESMGNRGAGKFDLSNIGPKFSGQVGANLSNIGPKFSSPATQQFMNKFGLQNKLPNVSKPNIADMFKNNYPNLGPMSAAGFNNLPPPPPKHTFIKKLEKDKEQFIFSNKPLPLPKGFKWVVFNNTDANRLVSFINKYYNTDEGQQICFDVNTLSHMMGDNTTYCLGIVYSHPNGNDILSGVVLAKPIQVKLGKKEDSESERDIETIMHVYATCLTPKYRKKGLFKVLVKELMRRANSENIKKGIFATPYEVEDIPFAILQYAHRITNIDSCVQAGFLEEPEEHRKRHQLVEEPKDTEDFHLGSPSVDTSNVIEFINTALDKCHIARVFNVEQFQKEFNQREVKWFVAEKEGELVGFMAYTTSTYLNQSTKEVNKCLTCVYALGEEEVKSKMFDKLFWIGQEQQIPVVNMFLYQLVGTKVKQINSSTGKVYVYIFNYGVKRQSSKEIGIFLF